MHEFQYMAARGYVVLFANPRGSIGYGLNHLKALRHCWGVPDYVDLMKCVDDVLRKGYIDKKRLFVTGGSYGGFMTNVITSKTDRFRAAVTERSVVDLTSMLASDYGHGLADEFGGMPWKVAERYRKLSPHTLAHRIKTPLLIVHSEQDLRCPIGQAEELFTTLKYLGRDVEFLRFMGESHGLSRCGRPQNRLERLKRITGWFDQHGGKR
jgi:dipeptidyl aminopeptidase/acylaminoacyl peptidase